MINSIITRLIQPNVKVLLLISVIFILLIQYTNIKTLLACILIIIVFLFHKEIYDVFTDIKKEEVIVERVIEDNKRKKKEIFFDDELAKIIKKLHKYRKYNTNAYDDGYNHIKMFINHIHDLEKDNMAHPKQYFENAQYHLSKSLNNFQSITISVPEETYNDALKTGNFEGTKLGNKIGKLCKRLHKHCYYLLYNLSLRFNEDWIKDPSIHKGEITLNYENVSENDNSFNFHWDLY